MSIRETVLSRNQGIYRNRLQVHNGVHNGGSQLKGVRLFFARVSREPYSWSYGSARECKKSNKSRIIMCCDILRKGTNKHDQESNNRY